MWGFNPRLPGGRRRIDQHLVVDVPQFQSTPSGGKATDRHGPPSAAMICFNPRLPGGRRHRRRNFQHACQLFQSTPSGGKATEDWADTDDAAPFQSTPSGGKATGDLRPVERGIRVSIHAFRGEGDRRGAGRWSRSTRFQSTPSGGKATGAGREHHADARSFNPRLPGGRRP